MSLASAGPAPRPLWGSHLVSPATPEGPGLLTPLHATASLPFLPDDDWVMRHLMHHPAGGLSQKWLRCQCTEENLLSQFFSVLSLVTILDPPKNSHTRLKAGSKDSKSLSSLFYSCEFGGVKFIRIHSKFNTRVCEVDSMNLPLPSPMTSHDETL